MEGEHPGVRLPGPASVRRRFEGRADQVRAARRLVADFLGSRSPLRDVAVLLVSEAVTNALLHSASGNEGGTFEVVCRRDGAGRLRIEVHDDGSPGQPRRRVHFPDALTGRGLELFDALATRWGASGGRRGHVVWFELDQQHRPNPRPAYHGGT